MPWCMSKFLGCKTKIMSLKTQNPPLREGLAEQTTFNFTNVNMTCLTSVQTLVLIFITCCTCCAFCCCCHFLPSQQPFNLNLILRSHWFSCHSYCNLNSYLRTQVNVSVIFSVWEDAVHFPAQVFSLFFFPVTLSKFRSLFTGREIRGFGNDWIIAVPCWWSEQIGNGKVNEIFTKCPSSGLNSD